jgi:hypothetical protein
MAVKEISISDSMSPRRAMECLAKAVLEDDAGCVGFRMYERNVLLGGNELNAVRQNPETFDEAARIAHFMRLWSMSTAFALPDPDSGLEKKYPFRSENLDCFLDTPHGGRPFEAGMEMLRPVQTDYISHLFNVAAEAAAARDVASLERLLPRIYSSVLDHVSNARAFLDPVRRGVLKDAYAQVGKLTPGIERQIDVAGRGTDPWRRIADEYADDEFVQENILPFIPH